MNDSECINPDERYVYQERLALLGVSDREPTQQEHAIAMQDVKNYRLRVSELLAYWNNSQRGRRTLGG